VFGDRLGLFFIGNDDLLKSNPVKELDQLSTLLVSKENISVDAKGTELNFNGAELAVSKVKMDVSFENAEELIIEISNPKGQEIKLGYKPGSGELYVNRTKAGKSDFDTTFASRIHQVVVGQKMERVLMEMLIDKSSVEFFFDEGAYALTDLVFPEADYNSIKIQARSGEAHINTIQVYTMQSVWNKSAP